MPDPIPVVVLDGIQPELPIFDEVEPEVEEQGGDLAANHVERVTGDGGKAPLTRPSPLGLTARHFSDRVAFSPGGAAECSPGRKPGIRSPNSFRVREAGGIH